jgi:hypothetical protein
MSCDVTVIVFGKHGPGKILEVLKEHNLGHCDKDNNFVCAGFFYDVREGGGWSAEEVAEAKHEGWYRPTMDAVMTRLCNTTNMGWSWHGEHRQLQFPIAHLISQSLALYLNSLTAVDDPQSGTMTYYRRLDHPEVHAVLNGKAGGFRATDYENFCEIKEGEDGRWEQMGWKRLQRKGIKP